MNDTKKGDNGSLIFVLQHQLKERKIWTMNWQSVSKENKRRMGVSVYDS